MIKNDDSPSLLRHVQSRWRGRSLPEDGFELKHGNYDDDYYYFDDDDILPWDDVLTPT